MKTSFRLLVFFAALSVTAFSRAAKPNFLFILVDDLGRQDLGCEGSAFHETPNIDRIAGRAMRFSKGYSACQVCSPSEKGIPNRDRQHADFLQPGYVPRGGWWENKGKKK